MGREIRSGQRTRAGLRNIKSWQHPYSMTKARFLNADDGRIVPKHCAAMRSHPSVTKCSVASRVTVLVFKCRNPLRYSSCWHSQALNVQEVASGRTAGSSMSNSITVRSIDPRDKSWLSRESRRVGVSMAELVRRMIREGRKTTEQSKRPSEVFARYFGKDHGVELPPRVRYGCGPFAFSDKEGE